MDYHQHMSTARTLRQTLREVATALGQIWEGYKQTPNSC